MSSYVTKNKKLFGVLALAVALQLANPFCAASRASGSKTIVFVCLHGAANSQAAVAHFNRIASERGLAYTAIARGIAVDGPDPTQIRDGSSLDGLEPTDSRPLTPTDAAAAIKVVAFDPVPDEQRGAADIRYWSDTPLAIKDYVAARDIIVNHIDRLVPALAERPRPQETLQGVVTAVDERNDRITVRLTSDTTMDFRVQDGLVFDAVHSGDQVEITIESIDGAKTIVGLRKD
jgi:Cu/Ag efflux protein CusF